MKRKFTAMFMALVTVLALIPALPALAAAPPASISAPINIGAAPYNSTPSFLYFTSTAPQDVRAILNKTEEELGYPMDDYIQIDVNVDNGGWQYTSDWDGSNYRQYCEYASDDEFTKQAYVYCPRRFEVAGKAPASASVMDGCKSLDWYSSHSISVRARYVMNINSGTLIFSPWSETYVVSNSNKMDYAKIMQSNIPALKSSELINLNGTPTLVLHMADDSAELQKLNAASGDNVKLEVFIKRASDADFINAGTVPVGQSSPQLTVRDYFSKQDNYSGITYDVKVRYSIDIRNYFQSGQWESTRPVMIYSPFSGESSLTASDWAKPELQKAEEMGLIPDSLKTADLTKPITRQEFAAVCVKAYEALSGVKAIPAVTNPFTDTKDVEVLKAYNVGITSGTSATTFSPNVLLNREQAATMLTRVFKKVSMPGWTLGTDSQFALTYTKPAPFADDKDISDWAKDSVYFMAANKIISGVGNNKFAPKNTTNDEEARGYANATREQALVIAVRMVENLK